MDIGDPHLMPTRDHHPVPRSRKGTRTIICCALCNNRKGDMMPDEWNAYMLANPGWWLLTKRERQSRTRRRRIIQPETPSCPMADALRVLLKEQPA